MSTTQIASRQILDGAITDAKVTAGAAILSSKLADGANFVKKDGTVALTGTLNAGSQLISNVQTPSGANDAANKSYVDTQIGNIPSLYSSKGAARAMSTGNVLVSNPGTAIFDTVTLVAGERLFLGNQTAPAENGLYTFNGSGAALTRDTEMDVWAETKGALFSIEEGSSNISKLILFTTPQAGTLGTTAITYQVVNAAGLSSANFVVREVPTGAINGVNTTFTLANTPVAGKEQAFLNGALLNVGAGNDYTISGATLTLLTAPLTGEVLLVNYMK